MTDPAARQGRYEIRVRGVLGATLLTAFPDLEARSEHGATVLCGTLPDSAALYGALAEVEALGLDLIDVHRCGDTEPRDRSC